MNNILKENLFIASYRSGISGLVAPASAAPFFVLGGASNKYIALRRVRVTGPTLTAVAYLNIAVTKYSTAPSAGTPQTAAAVVYRSDKAASSASLVQGYTAAPTAGSAVGEIGNGRILGQATTATANSYLGEVIIEFNEDAPPLLVSAAENFGVRFAAAPATAVTLSIEVDWEEYNIA